MSIHARLTLIERTLEATGGESLPEPLPLEVWRAIDSGTAIDVRSLRPGERSTFEAVTAMLATVPRFEDAADAGRTEALGMG